LEVIFTRKKKKKKKKKCCAYVFGAIYPGAWPKGKTQKQDAVLGKENWHGLRRHISIQPMQADGARPAA
jgi:hypothetical protein